MLITIIKIIELIVLYIGTPLLAIHLIYDYRVPLPYILIATFFLFLLVLLFDRSFKWKDLWVKGFGWLEGTRLTVFLIIFGSFLTWWAYTYESRHFLAFYKYNFPIWVIVMILYPLLSVTAQEIMYRVLFFHRYADLFGKSQWPAIIISAALFSYGHIIFWNWYAVVITFVGGLLFGYTYSNTRSFWAVFIEHSIYGCIIFTVGFGRYFFTGVPAFRLL